MKIHSFAEAKRKMDELTSGLDEIRQFLTMADEKITAVNMLKGVGSDVAAPAKHQAQPSGAPASWADRVFQVFKETGKPMFQKQAMERYEQMGLPMPDDKKELYRQISGAMSYLAKRKKTLVKTDEGYRLA